MLHRNIDKCLNIMPEYKTIAVKLSGLLNIQSGNGLKLIKIGGIGYYGEITDPR